MIGCGVDGGGGVICCSPDIGKSEPLEPHLYAVADRARRMIISEKKDQSIVVSGESGAGKTESCRAIVEHGAAGRKSGPGLGATPLPRSTG